MSKCTKKSTRTTSCDFFEIQSLIDYKFKRHRALKEETKAYRISKTLSHASTCCFHRDNLERRSVKTCSMRHVLINFAETSIFLPLVFSLLEQFPVTVSFAFKKTRFGHTCWAYFLMFPHFKIDK